MIVQVSQPLKMRGPIVVGKGGFQVASNANASTAYGFGYTEEARVGILATAVRAQNERERAAGTVREWKPVLEQHFLFQASDGSYRRHPRRLPEDVETPQTGWSQLRTFLKFAAYKDIGKIPSDQNFYDTFADRPGVKWAIFAGMTRHGLPRPDDLKDIPGLDGDMELVFHEKLARKANADGKYELRARAAVTRTIPIDSGKYVPYLERILVQAWIGDAEVGTSHHAIESDSLALGKSPLTRWLAGMARRLKVEDPAQIAFGWGKQWVFPKPPVSAGEVPPIPE